MKKNVELLRSKIGPNISQIFLGIEFRMLQFQLREIIGIQTATS